MQQKELAQIEHWVKIGKIAEENPDLPYEFIKRVLETREEMKTEEPIPYGEPTCIACL